MIFFQVVSLRSKKLDWKVGILHTQNETWLFQAWLSIKNSLSPPALGARVLGLTERKFGLTKGVERISMLLLFVSNYFQLKILVFKRQQKI